MPISYRFVPGKNGSQYARVEYERYNDYNSLKPPTPPPPGKGLGGKIIKNAKALVKGAGKFIKAALAIPAIQFGLLTAVMWASLEKPTTNGELPEYLKQPGERQEIKKGELPEWYGGQNSNTSYVYKYAKAIIQNGYFQGWAEYTAIKPSGIVFPLSGIKMYISGVDYGITEHWGFKYSQSGTPNANGSRSRNYQVVVKDATDEWKPWLLINSQGHKVIGFEPADGSIETNPYKGVPSDNPDVVSESTTNHAEIDGWIYKFDKTIRFDRNGEPVTLKPPKLNLPTPKKSNSKTPLGTQNSEQQSKIESPSEIPEPIPVPLPPKEKSIQEVEQPKEPEAPVIISNTLVRRADGTTQRTVQRMATPEEMEEYTRKINTAKIRNEKAAEVNQNYQNFYDLGYSKFENREPSELDKYKQEFRDKIETNRRSPFGKVEWYNMAPSRFDGTDDWKHPFGRPDKKSIEKQPQKTTNFIPVPEPDRQAQPELEPQLEPISTLEPVKQTPIVDDPIKEKLDNLPSKDDITLIVGGLEILRQIKDGIGGLSPLCLAPTLQPSIDRNNATTGLARAAILGQGQITQTAVNTANTTLTHPTWGLQAIVTNGAYGLQKIQGFAETAWKATRADKIVNALNTLLIVHNAMMLSNNIASTTSEALNLGLEALGIKDEEDKPIDIKGAVKGKLTSILQNWIGVEKYKQLTLRLASANRIYQSGANIVYGLRNVFDAGQYLVENISENVAFIGNALRRDGVVRENSYRLMPTDVNSTSRLLYRLEAANDVVDIIEEIASDAKDITEEIGELRENQNQFEEELEKVFKNRSTEETKTKNYATSTPEPLEEDEERAIDNGN